MREAPTLVVADGDTVRRARACRSLAGHEFVVLAEAADADAAVAAASAHSPDLCLLALDLPGSALHAISQISARAPNVTIVTIAEAESPLEMIEVLERGASGYLPRDLGDDELARSLAAAHAGEPAISRSLVPHLIEHMRGGARRLLELPGGTVSLTPREWEVAGLVQVGLPTDEIGRRLGLSPVTVRRHISSLARKTGAAGRDELVAALDRLGR